MLVSGDSTFIQSMNEGKLKPEIFEAFYSFRGLVTVHNIWFILILSLYEHNLLELLTLNSRCMPKFSNMLITFWHSKVFPKGTRSSDSKKSTITTFLLVVSSRFCCFTKSLTIYSDSSMHKPTKMVSESGHPCKKKESIC